jgi:hypothetical protein
MALTIVAMPENAAAHHGMLRSARKNSLSDFC